MLVDANFLGSLTSSSALPVSAPVQLVDDYLYSTLVRPQRRATLNVAHVQLAYGPLSGEPEARGAVLHAPA